MESITKINIRQDMLLEVLSRAVLHCRQEMSVLMDDVDAVPQDTDEYRRLVSVMDIAIDILEAVCDFNSDELVQISGIGERCHDGVTLEKKREEQK